jgi:hypothetical protein
MKFLSDLLEMCSCEQEEMMDDMGMPGDEDRSKSYADKDHAKEHAQEFLSRAKEILHYNKKEGDKGELNNMAKKFAKDYYDQICDELEKVKYTADEEGM